MYALGVVWVWDFFCCWFWGIFVDVTFIQNILPKAATIGFFQLTSFPEFFLVVM